MHVATTDLNRARGVQKSLDLRSNRHSVMIGIIPCINLSDNDNRTSPVKTESLLPLWWATLVTATPSRTKMTLIYTS